MAVETYIQDAHRERHLQQMLNSQGAYSWYTSYPEGPDAEPDVIVIQYDALAAIATVVEGRESAIGFVEAVDVTRPPVGSQVTMVAPNIPYERVMINPNREVGILFVHSVGSVAVE